MSDLDIASYGWQGDLQWTPTGDIVTVTGSPLGVQRVIRRLFTVMGAVIFHPQYGTGLLAKIGLAISARTILGLVRAQMFQEAAVSQNPPPQVKIAEIPAGSGAQIISISYQDVESGQPMLVEYETGVTPPLG